MGTKEEGQGRWGRSVEEYGGDLGGGESEGRVGAICFYTCLFWVFPSQLPKKGQKCTNPEKRPKVEDNTPFWHILSGALRQEDLMGEVAVVVFLLGGWRQEENWKKGIHLFQEMDRNRKIISSQPLRTSRSPPPPPNARLGDRVIPGQRSIFQKKKKEKKEKKKRNQN